MGLTLGIETSTGVTPPHSFRRTDSKSLLFHLGCVRANDPNDDLVRVLAHFQVSLEPLTRIVDGLDAADEEATRVPPPADDPERFKAWAQWTANRIAAWQSPATLVEVVNRALTAVQAAGDLWSEIGVTDSYFTQGCFRSDLEDIRDIGLWAQGLGIAHLRLFTIP